MSKEKFLKWFWNDVFEILLKKGELILFFGVTLFLHLLFPFYSHSQMDVIQEQNVLQSLDGLFWIKDNQKVRDSCEKYLALNGISNEFRSKLSGYKAMALGFLIDEEIKRKPASNKSYAREYDQIDDLYKDAVIFSPDRKTEYFCLAYEFFKNKGSDFHLTYLDSMIKYGYKVPIKSLVFNIDFYSGKRNWVGAEAGFLFYDQFCRVAQRVNGKKIKPDTYYPYSCSILHVGLRKSVSDRSWALSFSPVSGSYFWFNIRPLNLCYYFTPKGNTFCYSPEIGLHVWFLYVSYCKSFTFKENVNDFGGNLLNVKLQIPLFRVKNQ